MSRAISLPAIERTVSLGNYIGGVKRAITSPNTIFKHGLTTWWPTSGTEIREQFRRGMNQRINEAIPYVKRGRDHD